MKKGKKIFVQSLLVLTVTVLMGYTLSWIVSFKKYPVVYGVSFNQHHATSLGLDWQQTYVDMLKELKPKHIRIAAMWNEVEPVQGNFNFDSVDWMMNQAAIHDTKVLLVVGQKAPRWPECHVPTWVPDLSIEEQETALLHYVEQVVQRYKQHPALEWWQVENEAFINFKFGECEGFREEIVPKEVALVRSLDTDRAIVMTDSGELATWRQPSKHGDILGTTLYRSIQTPGGYLLNYDWLPAGFYKLRARLWGKEYSEFIVSELQAEPWFVDSNPTNTSVDEQKRLFPLSRMQEHVAYASYVGAHRVYLWGVEWWYFMKQQHDIPEYWSFYRGISQLDLEE